MHNFIDITKALSDENRVRALLALRDHELCVCQIIELLGLAPSTVSKHMTILRQARLVEGRKNGRWMYYRLADSEAPSAACEAIDWAFKHLSGDPLVRQDAKHLNGILKCNPVEVCKRQREKESSSRKSNLIRVNSV